MAVQLLKEGCTYVALTADYADGNVVKQAAPGMFRYRGVVEGKGRWETRSAEAAERLARFAAEELRAELTGATAKARAEAEAAIEASRATDAEVSIPAPPGLTYLGYQKAGIAFAASKPGVLIADEMGLGKTIQAIGVFNADPAIRRVLILCPASLKLNWKREFEKWATRPVTVALATTAKWPEAEVVVVNYDIAAKLRPQIDAVAWDLLVADECHALKNPKAQRTKAVLGAKARAKADKKAPIAARRRVFLTGTPILNRPIELWPLIETLDPDGLGSDFFGFAKAYCNARHTGYGWDFTGHSNLDELQLRLRASVMVRRLKADVLTELPAKRRQLIEFTPDGCASLVAAERAKARAVEQAVHDARGAMALAEAAGDEDAYRRAVAMLRGAQQAAFTEISRLRHETAVRKVPHVLEHLREAVEASGKVVVFAHHRDVIDAIAAEFGGAAVVVTGQTKITDRQAAVDRFQGDPSCTLFVGNILAAGVGLTLTAASHVVFAELDWRPGIVTQAEDRCHRIGQKNSVLVQHLVFEGSIDADMAQRIVAKQEVIDRALDVGAEDAELPELPEFDLDAAVAEAEAGRAERAAWAADKEARQAEREAAAAEQQAQRQKAADDRLARLAAMDAEAATMTPAQIAEVQAALRLLAGMDTDRAAQRNDVGFNATDTHIGHQLAALPVLKGRQAVLGRKIARKYWRQIGKDAVARMGA